MEAESLRFLGSCFRSIDIEGFENHLTPVLHGFVADDVLIDVMCQDITFRQIPGCGRGNDLKQIVSVKSGLTRSMNVPGTGNPNHLPYTSDMS